MEFTVSDLEQRLTERKRGEEHKQRNAARFMWHERLIGSVKSSNLILTSVCLAGLIMHDRDLTKNGYVALSLKDAADKLGVSRRAIIYARDLLVAEGWLDQVAFRGQRKAHYKPTFPDPARVHACSPLKVHARSPHPSSGTSGLRLEAGRRGEGVAEERKKEGAKFETAGAVT
jgi:hypothetical protein